MPSPTSTTISPRSEQILLLLISDERPKNLFQIILQENNPFTFKDNLDNPFKYRNNLTENNDPLMDLVTSSADRDFPHAPQILFDRQDFRQEALYGVQDVHISRCYTYNAIKHNRPDIVELCLKQGFQASGLIGEAWNCPIAQYGQLHSHNCLTAAADFGRASCVDVLVKYGANVDLPDGTGTTALQLARAHVERKHPRIHSSLELMTTSEDKAIFVTLGKATRSYMSRELVTASEDEAILVILNQASALIYKDTARAMVQVGEIQYQDEIGFKPNENEGSMTQTLRKLEVARKYHCASDLMIVTACPNTTQISSCFALYLPRDYFITLSYQSSFRSLLRVLDMDFMTGKKYKTGKTSVVSPLVMLSL
ncbi:hypothetical protein MMC14_010601 [Varicellaria rhodocarpa]|nr:hypothetical protein [Varicellaria rhodocarpa]